MNKTNTIKSLLVGLVLAVTTFGLVGALPSSNLANAQSAAGSLEADINSPEVKSLAQDKNLSKPEAKKRITWQNKASELDKQLKSGLPKERYGGTWIDEQTDRVKVGIVGGLTPSDAQKKNVEDKIASNTLGEATDVVPVKYSYAQLGEAMSWISERLVGVNQGAEWPIQVELNFDQNNVTLTVPESNSQMTKQQQSFFQSTQKRYNDMISVIRKSSKPERELCNWNYCNNPLRGGIPLHASGYNNYQDTYCTAGFIVRGSSGQKYVLTAGHCEGGGNGWATKDTNGNVKKIGPIKNSGIYYNGGHDGMTIDIRDTYGWSANGWIFMREGSDYNGIEGPSRNEEYDIVGTSTSGELEGQRVCKSGAVLGASCGRVKSPNVTFTAEGLTTIHLVRAEYCSDHGDSGAPVIRNHNALGIHVIANDGSALCSDQKFYAGIEPILRAFSDEYNQQYSVF